MTGVGVALGRGGLVTNSGAIVGLVGVSIAGGSGTVANSGTINANFFTAPNFEIIEHAGTGVSLASGGSVTNTAGALIVGYGWGVAVSGGTGTVANAGTILGRVFDAYGWGVSLAGGGVVHNGSATVASAAHIMGGNAGVLIEGGSGFVGNYGRIDSSAYAPDSNLGDSAVQLLAGGSVVNGSALVTNAVITGGLHGVLVGGAAGRIANYGTIGAGYPGGYFNGDSAVDLRAGGSVTNGAGGVTSALITGGTLAAVVVTGGPGTVVNAGTIVGYTGISFGAGVTTATVVNTGTIAGQYGGPAIDFGTAAARLEVGAGAVFGGAVVADGSGNTLELLAGGAGVVTNFGNVFQGFDSVRVDAGGQWTVGGTIAAGTVVDDGILQSGAGGLDLAGAVGGAGTIQISAGSVLEAGGPLGVASLVFLAGDDALVLDTPASATSVISGVGAGDRIDLVGQVATATSFSTATNTLTVAGAGGVIAALHFGGSYAAGFFHIGGDGAGGTNVTFG